MQIPTLNIANLSLNFGACEREMFETCLSVYLSRTRIIKTAKENNTHLPIVEVTSTLNVARPLQKDVLRSLCVVFFSSVDASVPCSNTHTHITHTLTQQKAPTVTIGTVVSRVDKHVNVPPCGALVV